MARTRTLGEMEEDARRIADEQDTTDRFPQDEVFRYLNQGIAELWDMLIVARGYAYYGRPYNYIGNGSAMTKTGSGPNIGVSLFPFGDYNLVVKIVLGGLRGTATFRYSLNGGTSYSLGFGGDTMSPILTAASYEIPGTNMTLTMAAGTYVADDEYSASARPFLVTSSGQRSYLLPEDFYKMHSVMIMPSGTDITPNCEFIELQQLDPRNEARLRDGVTMPQGIPYFFDIDEAGLSLYPMPQGAYGIYLKYVPCAPTLTDEDETFDGVNGWEEYPSTWAAYRMKLKNDEQPMVQALVADLNRLRDRIKALAVTRVSGTPERVHDVRQSQRWSRFRGYYR